MRKLDRSIAEQPSSLINPISRKQLEELKHFYNQPIEKRSQKRQEAHHYDLDVHGSLLKASNDSCAYCELPLDYKSVNVGTIRPSKLRADGEQGDNYWWLMLEWDNLVPICDECQWAKADRFPITGTRCDDKSRPTGEALLEEQALLINPFEDDPVEFFHYNREGDMFPKPGIAETYKLRAEATIAIFDLNRKAVIERRRKQIELLVAHSRELKTSKKTFQTPKTAKKTLAEMRDLVQAKSRMVNLSKQTIAEDLGVSEQKSSSIEALLQPQNQNALIDAINKQTKQKRSGRTKKTASKKKSTQVSIQEATLPPEIREIESLTIRRVVVKNFRIFKKAAFDVPEKRPSDLVDNESAADVSLDLGPSSKATHWLATADEDGKEIPVPDTFRHTGWKMLLGENGTGKSSLLEALAAILGGKKMLKELQENFENSLRYRTRSGSIEVYFHQREKPIRVKVGQTGLTWLDGEEAHIFLRAYGATRLLPKGENAKSPLGGNQLSRNVQNLFDAHYPLIDAEQWLRSVVKSDKKHFFEVCVAIKDLLDLNSDDVRLDFKYVNNEPKEFGLFIKKIFTRLKHFSAGYKTIVALACDIMAGNPADTHQIQGIVLIDEIGAHLHPSWRMRIIRRLEKTFPRVQFIATTHEPLCLHGLGNGEVALVRKNDTDISSAIVNDDLESPAGLRTDQLLTSEFFGLSTTIDIRTAEYFDRYYSLLAREEQLDEQEKSYLSELEKRLNRSSVLGNSLRDMYILKLIDKHLLNNKKGKRFPKPSKEIKEALLDASWRLDN